MKLRAATLALLALAACRDDAANNASYQQGNGHREAPASFGPDFAELKLGPTLEGSEFEASFKNFEGDKTGKLSGYVACSAGLASCDEAGEKPIYTYVLKVTPKDASSAFRTAERAYGFTGVAGYDKAEARAAMPGDSRLVTLCSDGVLVWAIEGGEGWNGKPVTVYWQSTELPSPSAHAYVLITDGKRSEASAPFPTEGSTDKCS